jgi:hypothetical protein
MMITENDIREMAEIYLDGHDFSMMRSSGGWGKLCGFQLSIVDDIPGSEHTVFIRDDNDERSLRSIMIRFSEVALTE